MVIRFSVLLLGIVCLFGVQRAGAERAAPNDAQLHSAAGTLEKTTKAGWIQFGQREFMFFAAGKTWQEAESTCVDYDAHLASVHSDREDAFIKRLIWNHVGSDRPSWLGGYNSPVVLSRWYWTDGSAFDFYSWTSSQPDGSGHCLQTNFKGGWDDLVCEQNLPFVCARGISKGAERAAPTDAQLHSAAGADAAVGGDLKLSAAAGTLEKTTKAGWIQFEQREFMFFAAGKTWQEAESTCVDYDAHLASVHSDREDAFIKRLIWNHVGSDRPSWLGGYNSPVVPSRWYWTDGSAFDFYSWTSSQPDGSGHCLQTNFKGGWDDLVCEQNLPFVCARGISKGAERAAPTDAQPHSAAGTLEKTTKAGWIQFGQREFMFFAAGKVWEEAESTCVDYDAHLASVHSDREDAFIKRLIWNHVGSDRPSWLGGYNSPVVPSRWYWTDGSAFDFYSWTPGQPDGSGHCLQTNFKGGWDDLVCDRNLPFVCARGIRKGV